MIKRILVTRPESQSGPLIKAIAAQGDCPIALPLLVIEAIDGDSPAIELQAIIDKVINLANYQHVIFISTNAVQFSWRWIDQYWPQLPVQQTWYAIGRATAAEIENLDVDVQQSGISMNSEALLSHPLLQQLSSQRVLIVRGQGGREHLKAQLQHRGAQVDYCEVYKRQAVVHKKGILEKMLIDGIDILTLSSAETIQRLLDQAMMDSKQGEILQIPVIVPGRRLFKVATELGFKHIIEAENAGLQAMLKAITTTTKTINS
ncbi:MAG: uroporphyrinogen-III synthase [Pseudomonadales bacterium]|nr:uroporphyrinogen-III synthase [Pseudomonadales bacterium]